MKICIATGTRAEYGLLRPLILEIRDRSSWQLQVLVTGAHLSPEFGLTYKEIEKDGVNIDSKVEMLLSADSATGIVKSMGLGMIGYADSLKQLSPDYLVLLGDRYEMLAIAASALILKIPIIHIHGGEITEGAYDDAVRHSISKMSYYHFASTEEYKKRIIQLGENPDRVFNVGAIGLDNVRQLNLLSKETLEKELGFKFKRYNYQITFHPATLDNESPAKQFKVLLDALSLQKDSLFIFTKSNADTGGREINRLIDDFVANNKENSVAFFSLGSLRFLSILKVCDAIVGNSSSGIIEAPSLHTATINIGIRQKGRIRASSVIDAYLDQNSINNAFEKVKSLEFRKSIQSVVNPYGNGNTAKRIVDILRNKFQNLFENKTFFDLI